MGHTIKGQTPRQYRPSSTRRASGLSPVNEARENARKRWNKLRQAVKARSQIQRNIRTKGHAKRGRFVMKNASPPKVTLWRNTPPGIYFMNQSNQKGRFKVATIKGFVPFPKNKSRKNL
jgi:hypothetical protein